MTNLVLELPDRKRTLTKKGAAVRQKLLLLATEILSRDGYAATTQQKLMDEAGLGRGSVLHQFPTRSELMVEVIRFIGDYLLEKTKSHFAGIDDPWDRLRSYPDIIWNAANSIPGLALAEIASAARWEPGLYDRIHLQIDNLDRLYYSLIREIGTEVHIVDLDGLEARIHLLIAASQGLVQDRNLHSLSKITRGALVEMKKDYLRYLAGITT